MTRRADDAFSPHNIQFNLWGVKFSPSGVLFGPVLLAGLFVHGVFLPHRVRNNSLKATRLVAQWGLFVPPLRLGVLLFVMALLFYPKRLYPHAESNEFKELVVPLVYSFILLELYFPGPRALDSGVRAVFLGALGLWLGGTVAVLLW